MMCDDVITKSECKIETAKAVRLFLQHDKTQNRFKSYVKSEDPNYSLTLLKQGQDIETKLCEDNPVEKHFNLGNTIGVQGTPSIITDEGKMIPGYLPPQDLLNILATNS